jgi:hypothetical protein
VIFRIGWEALLVRLVPGDAIIGRRIGRRIPGDHGLAVVIDLNDNIADGARIYLGICAMRNELGRGPAAVPKRLEQDRRAGENEQR